LHGGDGRQRSRTVGPGESVSKSYSVQPQRPANRKIAKMPAPKGSATLVGEMELKPPFWTSI